MSTADKPLNEIMEFEHVIRVDEDGSISDALIHPYFELSVYLGDDDEWHEDFHLPDGWELLRNFSGQYSYHGPVMHPSEFIGGGLEKHIRETPGYYVALIVSTDCGGEADGCSQDAGCNCESDGWAVAFKSEDGE